MQAYPQGRIPALPSCMPDQSAENLAEALLVRWATENRALVEARVVQSTCSVERAEPGDPQDVGALRVVDVSQYNSWHQMPFEQRISVQPFCLHPRLLDAAQVQVAHNKQGCDFD